MPERDLISGPPVHRVIGDQRLIVVEGPDGSGKSTLLAQLAKDLGAVVHHTGGPAKDREAWIVKLQTLWDFKRRSEGGLVLLDRLPQISEPIYGGLAGRPAWDLTDQMDADVAQLQPVIIYCRCESVAFMHSNIANTPKAHKPSEHLQWVLENYPQIVVAYDRKMARMEQLTTVLRYSWVNDTYANILEKIKCAASL